MTLDKSEAAQALAEIGASARRSSSLYSYSRSAPYLFIAGVMWLVADLLTQFTPYKSLTWPVVSAIGTIVFIAVAILQTRGARRDGAYATVDGDRAGRTGMFWKICGVWLAIFAFMVASFTIFPPTNEFQPHTFIGVFCGCLYVALGMWMGWRMVAVGVALAGLSLFGFFEVRDYYLVFMGVVGGGALMLGAFWLRTA
jgi:hypothetical protein